MVGVRFSWFVLSGNPATVFFQHILPSGSLVMPVLKSLVKLSVERTATTSIYYKALRCTSIWSTYTNADVCLPSIQHHTENSLLFCLKAQCIQKVMPGNAMFLVKQDKNVKYHSNYQPRMQIHTVDQTNHVAISNICRSLYVLAGFWQP